MAGALTELTRIAENRELFYTSGGVQALLRYQLTTNAQLIVNVNNAIANCALHAPSLASVAHLPRCKKYPHIHRIYFVASFPHFDGTGSVHQGRRSRRIIGGHKRRLEVWGTEVPQRGPGAEPR